MVLNVFAGQSKQDVCPRLGWKRPALHLEQLESPEMMETVPGRHCLHTDLLVAPSLMLKVPFGQSMHDDCPGLGWKRPARHLKQLESPEMMETVPGRHCLHVDLLAAPSLMLKVPFGQSMHDDCPGLGWKRPARHLKQLESPAMMATVPFGHGRQDDRPSFGWMLPAGHRVQGSEPVGLLLPGRQSVCPPVRHKCTTTEKRAHREVFFIIQQMPFSKRSNN